VPESQIELNAFILRASLKKVEVYFAETMELTWCQDKKYLSRGRKMSNPMQTELIVYTVACKVFRDRASVSE
jgi:hypothetical protein